MTQFAPRQQFALLNPCPPPDWSRDRKAFSDAMLSVLLGGVGERPFAVIYFGKTTKGFKTKLLPAEIAFINWDAPACQRPDVVLAR